MAAKKNQSKKQNIQSNNYSRLTNPSEYQSAIFENIKNNKRNLVIDAKAGSGKTTTLVEALYCVPSNLKTIFVAFNKKIEIELSKRVPSHIEVKTLHSLGYKIVREAFGKVEVDNDKSSRIVEGLVGSEKEKNELRYNLIRTISLCKGYLVETTDEIKNVIDKHGIELSNSSISEFASNVIKGLEIAANQNKLIDFDDMIWFPNKFNLPIPKHDFVFIDEAQDLNRAQLEIVMNAVDVNGRICAVLDKYQAIYSFRGADQKATEEIISRTNAVVLPLSVSYRCPKKVVELAQTIVSDFEASPNAIDGEVLNKTDQEMMKEAGPGDFIISRTNAPLVSHCLRFLKEGRKANIQGRDMGKSLSYMIVKSKANNVNSFLEWLEIWKNTECERLIARNKDCSHIIDRYECMQIFCEGALSLEEVKANIEKLFDDNDDYNKIILSTSHRSKGLERNKVWLLKNTFKIGKNQEESNIFYVAVTRSKKELYLVSY